MPVYSEQKRKNNTQSFTRLVIYVLSVVAIGLSGFLAFIYWTLPDKHLVEPTTEPTVEQPTSCSIRKGLSRNITQEQVLQASLNEQGFLSLVELWWHPTIGRRIACTSHDLLMHTTAGGSGLFPYITFYVSSNDISSPRLMGQYIHTMMERLESNENELHRLYTVTIQFINGAQIVEWQADYYDARWEINHGMDDEALFEFGMG